MIWNDEQQKRMLVTHSVCAGACRRRSSPGAVPAMGKANGWEANPTQRKRQKTKKLTQAQKTHTLAWCYCAISQHRQLKHHACVLKKDPTHEVDSVAAHNHHGSQYRRDSTRSSRFNTLFAKLLEKQSSEFLWSALIRVLPWTQTTITAGGLSRRPPQRLHFQSEKKPEARRTGTILREHSSFIRPWMQVSLSISAFFLHFKCQGLTWAETESEKMRMLLL